jgi:hypothetical protein
MPVGHHYQSELEISSGVHFLQPSPSSDETQRSNYLKFHHFHEILLSKDRKHRARGNQERFGSRDPKREGKDRKRDKLLH